MILAENISRTFKRTKALDNVSFKVDDGQLVALMGANGAGKSTLFDILATLDSKFSGRAEINGEDVRKSPVEVRKRIGYVPGRFSLYRDLTVMENLEFFASAYGAEASGISELSPGLWKGLKAFSGNRAGSLSGGMKQKLSICCAMVHNPSTLLLDEPTVGVDPVSRLEMWDELKTFRDRGASILVSTHYLDEASLADRIIFLHNGRLLLSDTPDGIMKSYPRRLYSIDCRGCDKAAIEAALDSDSRVCGHYVYGETIHAACNAPISISGVDIHEIQAGVEDVFIEILSKG